jgi:urease accessory protein
MLVAMTAAFALFHGHAHGTEMAANLSAASYGLGFVLSTALLHVFGVLLATRVLAADSHPRLTRWGGSAIAAVGAVSLGLLTVPML